MPFVRDAQPSRVEILVHCRESRSCCLYIEAIEKLNNSKRQESIDKVVKADTCGDFLVPVAAGAQPN